MEKELIEALRPFALEADMWDARGRWGKESHSDFRPSLNSRERASFTIGDLRRARTILELYEGE